jgi:hypothetical protein
VIATVVRGTDFEGGLEGLHLNVIFKKAMVMKAIKLLLKRHLQSRWSFNDFFE